MSQANNSEAVYYLTFLLNNEQFAIESEKVVEVLTTTTVFHIPASHPRIRGVINFRGTIVPLICTHSIFSLPPTDMSKRFRVIICHISYVDEKIVAAFVVDEVSDVFKVSEHELQNSVNNLEQVLSIFQKNGKDYKILDYDEIFSPEKFRTKLMHNS